MVLGGNTSKGITGQDLASLNGEKFNHGKTLGNVSKKVETDSKKGDDLRSVKSEYDYGSKKKFVDVLGNVRGKMKDTTGNGLAGLEALKNHEGNKNLDSASQRSKMSKMSLASSIRRRQMKEMADYMGAEAIPEEEEYDMSRVLKLVDKDGKTIEMSAEQLLLLE